MPAGPPSGAGRLPPLCMRRSAPRSVAPNISRTAGGMPRTLTEPETNTSPRSIAADDRAVISYKIADFRGT